MSDTGEKILNLSEFNANLVLQHFFVAPDDVAAQQAINFKFKMMRHNVSLSQNTMFEKVKELSEVTEDAIELSYDIYKDYLEDFFPKKMPPDHRAMVLVAICGSDIHRAHEPIEDADNPDGGKYSRNEGFDVYDLNRACDYELEAQSLMSGDVEKDEIFSVEAVYLAHVFMMKKIYDVEENFDDMTDEELQDFATKTLINAYSFLRPKTELGHDLKKATDSMMDRIKDRLHPDPSPQTPPPRGSHLRLVQS